MHRDIKPENIIIRNKDGSMSDIILADFGLSESIEKEEFIFKRFKIINFIVVKGVELRVMWHQKFYKISHMIHR